MNVVLILLLLIFDVNMLKMKRLVNKMIEHCTHWYTTWNVNQENDDINNNLYKVHISLYENFLPGFIKVSEWCTALETSTGLNLPWRLLRDKLVILDTKNQLVKYLTTFDKINDYNINVSILINKNSERFCIFWISVRPMCNNGSWYII